MATSFYSDEELRAIGLRKCGSNVLISKKASIYGASNITIGSNVRIDDFCILSGNVKIGSNIHLAAYSALYGGEAGITIEDFANISSRVCIYAVSDDFSGGSMTNPTIPEKYKEVQNQPVVIHRHAIIGSGCTILPGTEIGEGSALGAMSLCKRSTDSWKIYAGVPAAQIKQRGKALLKLEKEFLNEQKQEEGTTKGSEM